MGNCLFSSSAGSVHRVFVLSQRCLPKPHHTDNGDHRFTPHENKRCHLAVMEPRFAFVHTTATPHALGNQRSWGERTSVWSSFETMT